MDLTHAHMHACIPNLDMSFPYLGNHSTSHHLTTTSIQLDSQYVDLIFTVVMFTPTLTQ